MAALFPLLKICLALSYSQSIDCVKSIILAMSILLVFVTVGGVTRTHFFIKNRISIFRAKRREDAYFLDET